MPAISFDPWPLLLPALLLVAFAAAVARSRELRWTVSQRMLAGFRVTQGGARACPHLGLEDDPFSRQELPSADHRCYLYMQRDRIDLTHQKVFCLSTAHTACPWLSIVPASARQPLPARVGAAARPSITAATQIAATALRQAASAAMSGRRWAIETAAPSLRAGSARLGATTATGGRSLRGWAALVAGALLVLSAWAAARTIAAVRLTARSAWWLTGRGRAGVLWLFRSIRQRAERQQASPATEAPRSAALAQSAMSAAAAAPRPDLVWIPVVQRIADNLPEQPAAVPALAARLGGNVAGAPAPNLRLRQARLALELGMAAVEAGREEEAYAHFVAATEADAASSRAWYWRAKTAPTLSEVVACLSQVLEREPNNEKVRRSHGLALELLEEEQQRVRRPGLVETPAASPAPAPERAPLGERLLALVRGGLQSAAGLACLMLAALWLGATLAPALPGQILPIPPALLPALPGLGSLVLDLPELLPGYRLLAGMPHTLGFLALCTGIGMLLRFEWPRTWALLLAVTHLWLTLVQAPPTATLAMATAIAAAIGAGVLANPPVTPLSPRMEALYRAAAMPRRRSSLWA